MKKLLFVIGIILLLITGCRSTDIEDVAEKTGSDIILLTELNSEEENNYQVLPVLSKVEEWTQNLLETHKLIFDLNTDNQEDMICLAYEEKEGSQYISRFKVKIESVSDTFTIEDYDASFEKLEVFDFNQDGIDELIILFNTHGNGGQGTHDIFVLSIDNNSLKTYNFKPNTEGLVDLEDSWNIDEPYSIQKVLYNGSEEMLVRQYVWGDQGHSDQVGDLVSIVSLSKESNYIMPEKTWMELENH